MDAHRHRDPRTVLGRDITRRDVVGGGMLLAAMLLTGCGKRKVVTGDLPDVAWPDGRPVAMPPPAMTPAPGVPSGGAPAGPVGIMPRSSWTSAGIARPNDIYALGGVRRITIHHDGLPPTSLGSQGAVASRIEMIRQSHVQSRGWADIGYHYIIDPQGRVWQGRNDQYQGAHVKDQNENNLGILCMGNFERQSPSRAQLSSLDRFVALQMQRHGVPMSRVRTHREMAQTSCPGRNLQSYMVRTRSGGGQLAVAAMRSGLSG
jgi:hypothetical protein